MLQSLLDGSFLSQHPYVCAASAILVASYAALRYFVINGASTNGEEQNLNGKVFMVTGATSGIGSYTAQVLYRQGAKVYLACRSEDKTLEMIRTIRDQVQGSSHVSGGSLHFLRLDLNDLESVRECAKEFLKTGDTLDGLINNAGCVTNSIRYTKQGFEEMMQANVLGHHLLIELLWQNMDKNPHGARIVIVASMAHMFVNDNDFWNAQTKTYSLLNHVKKPVTKFSSMAYIDTNKQYGLTKLCNIYQVYNIHELRIKNNPNCKITINCCHPGAIRSGLVREAPFYMTIILGLMQLLFFKNVKQGSQNTLHLACSPDVQGKSGAYYDDCRVAQPRPVAENKILREEFARLCDEVCQPYL
ncbi:hypothetical protein C9374_009400 [Naegleria lovaniensis]|uniref:Uncharacterized protein n=1 Tax=Naegleria lovaniensis TaxID=51637 RepID=A0AA88KK48_NAELO|nr:uncharacterized protein C9374_009400 [Naegleria lovaniensis]KAG2377489.1 hypothetical protein C9374_009400 [Naegleria lovaniensis]